MVPPMGMGHSAIAVSILSLALATGCSDDTGDGGGDTGSAATAGASTAAVDSSGGANNNVLPTVEIELDPSTACGADGSLLLRATLVGCVSPPPAPCTLPDPPRVYDGDTVACPATETAATMRVQIEQAGRYHVELAAVAADGTETAQCYAEADDADLIVEKEALDTNPTIAATPLGSGGC